MSYQRLRFEGFEILFSDTTGIGVYRNPGALPRAYVVGETIAIADPGRRFAHMRGRGFDPYYQAITERAVADTRTGVRVPAREAVITRYENERVELELGDHAGGLLVLSDTYYPGWKAWVDDQPADVLQVNHLFRGVQVRPGAERVLFEYQPDSFATGLWISIGAAVLFLAALTGGWRSTLPAGAPTATMSAHRFKAWTLQIVLITLIHALVTQWPGWAQAVQRSQLTGILGG